MSITVRRSWKWIASLVILSFAISGCAGSGKSSVTSDGLTKVSYIQATQNLSYLPIFVAIEAGYFKDEGIELDRQPNLANAAQLAQLAASGKVDIAGVGSSGGYSVIAAGRPLQSIAALCKQQVFQLVLGQKAMAALAAKNVTPTSPLADRVKALKGLTLGVTPQGTLTDVLMRATLQTYDVEPDKDVTLQPLTDDSAMLAAARQGKIDGFLFPPPSTLSLAQDGGAVWIDYAKGEVPDVEGAYQLDLVASTNYTDKNKDTVVKFLRAVARADALIKSDPAQAIKLVRPTFSDLDESLYEASVQSVAPAFADGIVPTEDAFKKTLGLTNKTLAKPLDLTFDQTYRTDLAEQASK